MAQSLRKLDRRVVRRVGRSRLLVALAMLGPGLIAANAGNDAGGITTWSVIGSRYGYSMVWLLVILTPVLAIVQEMNARVGVVTGRGLAGLIRENFSLKVTALAILATALANFGTTVAEFSGIAAAGGLFHVPTYVGVPVMAIAVWFLVTRGSYRKVERVLLALGFVLVTYVVAGLIAGPDWGEALRGATVPRPELDSLWVFTVIAAVGTTLTPWGQFFIQAAVVDRKTTLKQYVYTKYEIYAGSVIMTSIDFFIVVACASVLYKDGIVVESAQEAAMALEPLLGSVARYLFGIGLLAVSILAAGVLPLATAYVVCEAFGFESGLDTLVPRGAGLQRHHHLLHVRAGGRGDDPRPAAGQGDPGRADAQRRAPAGDPAVHAEHGQQPARDGRARQRTRAQRHRLEVLDRADRAERDARALAAVLVAAREARRRQDPSTRSCERGSMCTSTSAFGMQARMSAAMCSATSCASPTLSDSSTVMCRSMCRRLPALRARSRW